DYSGIETIKKIQGGSINEAFYVRTVDAEFFMKVHGNSPKGFVKSEAIGLRLIKETGTISLPNYLSYSDQPGNAFLLLEWIEGKKSDRTEEILGFKLAELHKCYGRMHGFETDTYIGLVSQPNELKPNWLEYFRGLRLGTPLHHGIDKGFIHNKRRQ